MSGLEDGTFDSSQPAERLVGPNRDRIPAFSLSDTSPEHRQEAPELSLEPQRQKLIEQHTLVVSMALCDFAAQSTGDPEQLTEHSSAYHALREQVEADMNAFVIAHGIFTDGEPLAIHGELFTASGPELNYRHINPGHQITGNFGGIAVIPAPREQERDEYFAYHRGESDALEYRAFDLWGVGIRLDTPRIGRAGKYIDPEPEQFIVPVHYRNNVAIHRSL